MPKFLDFGDKKESLHFGDHDDCVKLELLNNRGDFSIEIPKHLWEDLLDGLQK